MRGDTTARVLVLVGLALPVSAQNLVPNGSFESGGCPGSFNCTQLPTGWSCATTGTADWFKGGFCSSGVFGVPSNIFGNQPARTGVAYAGLHAIVPSNVPEYLVAALQSPLDAGQLYCAEMSAVLPDGLDSGIKSGFLGLLLTDNPPPSGGAEPLYTSMHGSPQATNSVPINDVDRWVTVAGTFTATGSEGFVTVGVFPANSGDLGGIGGGSSDAFLDDVGVSPTPAHAAFSLDSVVFEGDLIGFDAAITTGETAWSLRVCRVGEDCTQPEYGYYELNVGTEVGNFELTGRVSAPFEFEGSEAGISYAVALGAYDGCSGWDFSTLTVTVFTPPGEECTELLTFDGLPTGSGEIPVTAPWVEGDFSFDTVSPPLQLQTFAPDATEWSGSKALHAGTLAGGALGLTMRRTDGDAFSICKAELTEGGFLPPRQEDFFGYDDLAGTNLIASKSYTLDGNLWVPETVTLDDFRAIAMLETLGYTDYQWDDICICEGPERCYAGPSVVALWPGDDCSGWEYKGHHGFFVGGNVCGPFKKVGDGALGFNGSNHLEVPHDPDLDFGSGDFSVAAWVLVNPGGTGVILEKLATSGYRFDVIAGGFPGLTTCNTGGQCAIATASESIADGTWHHVAATRSGTQTRVYVDAALRADLSPGIGDTSNSAVTRIGQGVSGLLDDVTLFNTTLSQTQVREIFLADSAGICEASQFVRVGGFPTNGSVTVGLSGLDVTTATLPGESAEDLVFRLVALISAEPLFANISATAQGDTLVLTGSGQMPFYVVADDPGLDITSSFQLADPPIDVLPGPTTPIGHWKLDEGSGSTALDSAGPNDGAIFGAAIDQAGQISGAYLFDGTDDYVDLGAQFDGEFISVSAWVKADFPYTLLNFPTIAGAADDFGSRGWNLYYQGVDDAWAFFNSASGSAKSPTITSDSELGRGVWQHIVGVGDGGLSSLYINGVLVGSDTGSGVYTASIGSVRIGDNDEFVTAAPFFPGLIDDVCVFDQALTASLVAQLYDLGLSGSGCVSPAVPSVPALSASGLALLAGALAALAALVLLAGRSAPQR